MDDAVRSKAEVLALEFASQARTMEDLSGLMRLMMKSAMERMLDTEMDVHLGRKTLTTSVDPDARLVEVELTPALSGPEGSTTKRSPNRRNGRSKKTVQGDLGEVTIATPRDRDGTFEPQLIAKHQRRIPGFDDKIM